MINSNGVLYIVGTPIGNLEDITYRAVSTLSNVNVIVCEDTRHTLNLLNSLNISVSGKRLICCNAINEKESALGVVKLLSLGSNVAYCSDAGTPGISDPGSFLVNTVRDSGFTVIPIPGVSAVSTLISVSGLHGKTFLFEGFLSVKPGKRKKRLVELLSREDAFIIYESPYRIEKTLTEISLISPNSKVIIGREMTKMHEEFIFGTATEVLSKLTTVKGEFAVCIFPNIKVS